ncbi:MAG: Hpt domain-containing protein [Desulfobacteraceae bacterium]
MMDQDELVRICVRESQVHLESIESGLLSIRDNTHEIDYDELRIIARSIRSVKGGCFFYGFRKPGELARQMESLVLQVLENHVKADPGLVNALLTGSSALKEMLDDIGKSEDYDTKPVMALLEEYAAPAKESGKTVTVRETARQDGNERAFEVDEQDLARFVKSNQTLYTLTLFLKQDLTEKGKTPFDVINSINSLGELIDSTMDIDSIQGLSDCLENEISFVTLFAAELSPDRIGRKLDIPEERLNTVDMSEHMKKYKDQGQGDKDTIYLVPETDLVASRIEELRDRFSRSLKENPSVSNVVLKADHIENMDSLGVNLIIGIYRQVHSESKSFEITGAGEKFLKVANFFRFPDLFNINREDQAK